MLAKRSAASQTIDCMPFLIRGIQSQDAEFGVRDARLSLQNSWDFFGMLSFNNRVAVLFGLICVATISVGSASAQEKPPAPADFAPAPVSPAGQAPSADATTQPNKIERPQPKTDPQKTDDLKGQQTSGFLASFPIIGL